MKVAMLGAGGVGCYFGARLLAAGHDVVFVARGAHQQALAQGLTLSHPDFSWSGAVNAITSDSLMRDYTADDFDVLMLCAKSAATAPMLAQLQPWLAGAGVPLLSLQNGVRNEEQIAQVLGKERTLGGLAVRIGAHVVAPGVVEVAGRSEIEMGAWPDAVANPVLQQTAEQWVTLLQQAGVPATLSSNIRYDLWRKLVINNGVNPLSALTFLDTRSMTRDPVLRPMIYQLMQETVRAANAAGVAMEMTVADDMLELITAFDAIKTSMLVDREKGRPLELDDICGPVIEECQRVGEPATTTAMVRTLLQFNLRL